MTLNRLTFSLGTLALVLAAAASPARAQSCQTTANCHKGFVCVQNVTTEPAPPPATDPSGPTKAALVAPVGGTCQPADCASDNDCGTNMVCHTETIGACSGGAAVAPCPPNTDCSMTKVDVAPPTCTETKVSKCAFTWQLPCSADTDCGAGFMCTPTVTGSCSGGSGTATPSSTGGGTAPSSGASPSAGVPLDLVAPVPPDSNCTETKSFPGWCQPKVTNCASDSECPMDWTCTEYPSRSAGSPVAGGAAGTSGTTNVGSDTKIAPGEPNPSTPVARICTSPYGSGGYGVPKAADGSTTTNTGGTGSAGTGGTVPPQQPSPKPTTNGGFGTQSPSGAAAESNGSPGSGCALGGGAGSSVALAGLALAAIVIARRKRG